MKGFLLLLLSLSISYAQQAQPGPGGVITGVLRGDNGAAIIGAYVSLHLLPPYPLGRERAREWFTTTAGGGAFRFNAPYYGRYRLCAQAPNGDWLNPCEWGLQLPVASISIGQKSVNLTMVVKRGVTVPIRIDDPPQLLAQHLGKTPGADLLLGVNDNALMFHPAPLSSKDSSGRSHQIVIPFDASVNLAVTSGFFRLADASGQEVARAGAAMIPMRVASGQQAAIVKLVVIGSKK